jgi:hypothetical protein
VFVFGLLNILKYMNKLGNIEMVLIYYIITILLNIYAVAFGPSGNVAAFSRIESSDNPFWHRN